MSTITSCCLETTKENKKDRKVFFIVIAEMFDLYPLETFTHSLKGAFRLCCSPEDEPWPPWLGNAAKAGKAEM